MTNSMLCWELDHKQTIEGKYRTFVDFMPMAGDCRPDRAADVSGDEEIADLLVRGLQYNGYTDKDFRIIAMVGENDGTKYSIQPQIEVLRENHADLITESSLIYWENAGGGAIEKNTTMNKLGDFFGRNLK